MQFLKLTACLISLNTLPCLAADYQIRVNDTYHYDVTDNGEYWLLEDKLGSLSSSSEIKLPKDAKLEVGPVFVRSYFDDRSHIYNDDGLTLEPEVLRTWVESFRIEENKDLKVGKEQHSYSIKYHLGFAASFDDHGLIERYFNSYYPDMKAYLNGQQVELIEGSAIAEEFRKAANKLSDSMNGDQLILLGNANYWVLGFPPAPETSEYQSAYFLKSNDSPLLLADPEFVERPFPYQYSAETDGLFNRVLIEAINTSNQSKDISHYKVVCHSFQGCAYAKKDALEQRMAIYVQFKRADMSIDSIHLYKRNSK